MNKTNSRKKTIKAKTFTTLKLTKKEILEDYTLGWLSRQVSLLGRREVLTGKAKFGIFGDGKELPQLALARFFDNGDFRSGYYRDQTLLMALGLTNPEKLFAQLYADPSLKNDPHSGGRQMNGHYLTPTIDENGHWLSLTKGPNIAADVSSTASQMSRAVGLALASKKFRNLPALAGLSNFSHNGNEVVFATIGDASTSEGIFWESINACGVMQIPLILNVWDDGYGISVPTKYQTTKGDISKALAGFEIDESGDGYYMHKVKGWDYEALIAAYQAGIPPVRETHNPAIFHINEITQPQGHSTSGSHERYKSKERLQWEKDFDCLVKMKEWILANKIAKVEELDEIEQQTKEQANKARKKAWKAFREPIDKEIKALFGIYNQLHSEIDQPDLIFDSRRALTAEHLPTRKDVLVNARKALFKLRSFPRTPALEQLIRFTKQREISYQDIYSKHLFIENGVKVTDVKVVPPVYNSDSPTQNGYQLLNKCFDAAFARNPKLLAFGEDVGHIGDVNQGMAGLQEKYGKERIFDTGIREATIVGQGIGMAMRGLRPIAEIQYLDYFIYGLQPIVDELSTLQYRTAGQQKAPLIIRTRGHRLEGIWHAGSPMAMILHSCRGVRLCVPRNMTQAAGFYNALLQADEPGIIVECLNGYRLKEQIPENISEFTTPFGVPEVLIEGSDVTLVTYGSCVRIAKEAMDRFEDSNISIELIDVQTLQPFDVNHLILESLKKTNRIVFFDEDVPGGTTAFMMQEVLEKQGGYRWLDSAPVTITAKAHRTAYGSDGDYFCKPSAETVFHIIYDLMRETDPDAYPLIY